MKDDYGLRTALGWVNAKFGIELNYDDVAEMEPAELKQLIVKKAEESYDDKESEYPVMAGLQRFSTGTGGSRIDRDALVAWARQRFETELSLDDLKNKQREEIRAVLIDHSRQHQKQAKEALVTVKEKVYSLFEGTHAHTAGDATGGNGALTSLSDWLKQTINVELPPEELAELEAEELERKLHNVVEDHFHPEIRRMERMVLLEIVDSAWKDHLLTMDYLRSAVGLKGYAQLDPKVEYKREGMRLFDQVWTSIDERCTDLVFHMQQLDEGFVGSTWVETSATHEQASNAASDFAQQQDAANNTQGDAKVEPIRKRGEQIRRNDPCPCNSGKKYKNCCMRKQGK